MGVVIEGKKYDPKTDPLVVWWSNKDRHRNWRWEEESLYRTRGGDWYIAGKGLDVQPLSPAEALRWLKEHDQWLNVAHHFGDDDDVFEDEVDVD